MNEERFKEIKNRANRAYPGTWLDDVDGNDGGLRVYREGFPYQFFHIWFGDMEETEWDDHTTAKFVAHARQDVPDLLDELQTASRVATAGLVRGETVKEIVRNLIQEEFKSLDVMHEEDYHSHHDWQDEIRFLQEFSHKLEDRFANLIDTEVNWTKRYEDL